MPKNHHEAPVLDALAAYRQRGELGFTPPGHKQARGAAPEVRAVLGDAVFLGDVLASGGLDDRRMKSGVLQRAEDLMADAVHAEHAFFSTCGSSLSVKAAMLSVAAHGQKLLVGRDAHKAVISGLILSGIRPVWVEPQWDTERRLAHPPSPEAYERAFEEHPDAKGALVTSPTPYGVAADLRAIADVCHRRSRPLVVDEAWGAHLPFHPDLPTWAMDAGADVRVTSIHKMGSGLEQGSVFHLQGGLSADPRRRRGDDAAAADGAARLRPARPVASPGAGGGGPGAGGAADGAGEAAARRLLPRDRGRPRRAGRRARRRRNDHAVSPRASQWCCPASG